MQRLGWKRSIKENHGMFLEKGRDVKRAMRNNKTHQ